MSEDIHQRIFVKSKKSGQYVNAHDICSWDPKFSIFNELVCDRNYDVFSLLGSRRSEYKELNYSNYGMPDFLKDTIFDDYCRECGYYGFIWFKLPDLLRALTEYREHLVNPLKYLDEDSDEYADWRDNVEKIKADGDIGEFMAKYRDWLNMHKNIYDNLNGIIEKLNQYTDIKFNAYDKLIDINETIFLFFFDT